MLIKLSLEEASGKSPKPLFETGNDGIHPLLLVSDTTYSLSLGPAVLLGSLYFGIGKDSIRLSKVKPFQ